jgi:hypothetical protein
MEHYVYTHRDVVYIVVLVEPTVHPRMQDYHLGTMVCWHKRYNLGDQQPSIGFRDWLIGKLANGDEKEEERLGHLSTRDLENIFNDRNVSLPLYLYDHGALSISTIPFKSLWDSGRIGLIYVDEDAMQHAYGEKWNTEEARRDAIKILTEEVTVYDHWLRGECYAVYIEFDNKLVDIEINEHYDYDYVVGMAKVHINHLLKELY